MSGQISGFAALSGGEKVQHRRLGGSQMGIGTGKCERNIAGQCRFQDGAVFGGHVPHLGFSFMAAQQTQPADAFGAVRQVAPQPKPHR